MLAGPGLGSPVDVNLSRRPSRRSRRSRIRRMTGMWEMAGIWETVSTLEHYPQFQSKLSANIVKTMLSNIDYQLFCMFSEYQIPCLLICVFARWSTVISMAAPAWVTGPFDTRRTSIIVPTILLFCSSRLIHGCRSGNCRICLRGWHFGFLYPGTRARWRWSGRRHSDGPECFQVSGW